MAVREQPEQTALKIESKPLDDRQVELTIEVPQGRLQGAMRAAARRLSKRDKIPGFRPGKVPFEVALGRYGEETIFEEALESLGQDIYRQALDQSELEPFAPGALNEVVSKDPLVLRYSVPLSPEVKLGNYRKLRLKYKPPEVKDEAVNEMMEELRQRQALIEPADRPVQLADVAVIDVEGRLLESEGAGETDAQNAAQPEKDVDVAAEDEQEAHDHGHDHEHEHDHDHGTAPSKSEDRDRLLKETGISLLLDDDTDWPFPGIAEHLVGKSAGDQLTVEHTFSDDYQTESLRGETAQFDITLQEVKSRTVPEWNDDVARNVGDYEDLLDLRVKVREGLTKNAERDSNSEFADEVIEKLVEQASVEFPPFLVEQEIDDLIHDLGHRLEAQGLTMEQYLQVEEKSADELREDLRPRAKERVTRALVLGQLIEDEQLEVADQEIDTQLDQMVAQLQDPEGRVRKALGSESGRRRIRNDLLFDKAVERAVAIAKGEDPARAGKSPEAPELQAEAE